MIAFSAVGEGQQLIILVKVLLSLADSLLQGQTPQVQSRIPLRLSFLSAALFDEVVELAQEGGDAGQEGVQLYVLEPMIFGPREPIVERRVPPGISNTRRESSLTGTLFTQPTALAWKGQSSWPVGHPCGR